MIRRNNCVTERAVDFITILSGDFARHIINHHFFTSSSVRFGMTSLIEYRKFSVLCRPHVYLYFFYLFFLLFFYLDIAFEIISGTDCMSSRHANQT